MFRSAALMPPLIAAFAGADISLPAADAELFFLRRAFDAARLFR